MGRLDEEKGGGGAGKPKPSIGILGGGQLALMLSEAAVRLGFKSQCFSEKLDDQKTVEDYLAGVDVMVFESDFLPFSSLRAIQTKKFRPEISVIEKLSDKIKQKQILNDLKIPTARHDVLTKDQKIDVWIENNYHRFFKGCVFKWARGGYDGKGVHVSSGSLNEDRDFVVGGLQKNSEIFAEERIDFVREISQVSAFSVANEWAHYPLVISEQENGICRNVFGPAKNFGVDPKIEIGLQAAAKSLGENMKLHGVFAMEAFETKDGNFFINEIAPRVHNTGHFSLNFSAASQFENHLRAVTGMKLGAAHSSQNFFMRNILGDRMLFAEGGPDASKIPPGWHLKWYNKQEVRKGRKMGHLNYGGFAVEALASVKESSIKLEQQILNSLR